MFNLVKQLCCGGFGLDRVVRVYPNSCVEKIIAGIPRGHYHLRMAIVLRDQVIVLHEATVAAIVRAYASVAIHPTRKGVVYSCRRLSKGEKKHGFAEYQLVEDTSYSEDDAVYTIEEFLEKGVYCDKVCKSR